MTLRAIKNIGRLRPQPERDCACPEGLPGDDPAFSQAITALGAKLARADGRADEVEFQTFVEVFPAEEAAARDIRRLYRLARETTRGYEGYARMLAKRYDRCPNTLAKVLDGLFHVAASDKAITVHELAFLERVGEIFGLSQLTVRRLKAEHLGLAPGDPSGCWAWPPTPPTRPCARPGSRRCRPATPTARWAAACRRSWSRPPRPRHPRSTPPSTQ